MKYYRSAISFVGKHLTKGFFIKRKKVIQIIYWFLSELWQHISFKEFVIFEHNDVNIFLLVYCCLFIMMSLCSFLILTGFCFFLFTLTRDLSIFLIFLKNQGLVSLKLLFCFIKFTDAFYLKSILLSSWALIFFFKILKVEY